MHEESAATAVAETDDKMVAFSMKGTPEDKCD